MNSFNPVCPVHSSSQHQIKEYFISSIQTTFFRLQGTPNSSTSRFGNIMPSYKIWSRDTIFRPCLPKLEIYQLLKFNLSYGPHQPPLNYCDQYPIMEQLMEDAEKQGQCICSHMNGLGGHYAE